MRRVSTTLAGWLALAGFLLVVGPQVVFGDDRAWWAIAIQCVGLLVWGGAVRVLVPSGASWLRDRLR